LESIYNMNRGIVFFIGLLFGILICALLHYFDIKIFEAKILPTKEKVVVTKIKTDTVFLETPKKIKKQDIENQLNETPEEHIEIVHNENETPLYETSFSYEGDERDEIFSDQLLKTKTVKVKLIAKDGQQVILPENFFRLFEIQLWSTPIKNKVTYQRNQNMLKIKGMEIDNINVVFWNDNYYIEVKSRYYSIPETEYFTKFNPVTIPQQ